MTMQVVNREGEREDVRFDAIHDKLKSLTYGLDPNWICLLYTSPSPRDRQKSRMPSSA